jgi:hypothetical protein
VRYGIRPPSEVGESSFAFDTSGGTQHITQSLATIASYAATGTPPNFGGAVGVTHDSVEGWMLTLHRARRRGDDGTFDQSLLVHMHSMNIGGVRILLVWIRNLPLVIEQEATVLHYRLLKFIEIPDNAMLVRVNGIASLSDLLSEWIPAFFLMGGPNVLGEVIG